jgi:hypothetical protein
MNLVVSQCTRKVFVDEVPGVLGQDYSPEPIVDQPPRISFDSLSSAHIEDLLQNRTLSASSWFPLTSSALARITHEIA